ncbi:RNA polymerase sigma-70 factor (ECF subfamily) [Chitinophaga dinghuensis]|uniref:RNA polymerase sigma-70 factor (ECF subfamily) n=1 Tax=Chitinophaga dinghuensis TaxID=1539050 RepID=A0A327W436_9BACT|nr:sigma-70 family RNA polymerase sigma factor [Chitinophaga dinghuensis]RAJ83116.1 RNA polymerase sigma-70 factor (ECF subfamily) [Chitinophaga dinghuensis]
MQDSASYKREQLFNSLYYASRDKLYQYLRRYTHDNHLLQDLLQQSYMKVWDRIDNVYDVEAALPLLKVIARNLLVDLIRKRLKEDEAWMEKMQTEAGQLLMQPETGSRELMQALDIAIDQLPDNCRKVYLLHRDEGLSYRDISLRLSISVSMVEKHMSKAIRLLKQELLVNGDLVLLLVAVNRLL